MRYFTNGRRGKLLPRVALLTGALLLPLAACDTESLLEVEDPDIVTPASLEAAGKQGLTALFAGALGEFALAYDGGAGGGSFEDGVVTTVAYFTDEAYLSGTFPSRTEFDQRSVDNENFTLGEVFRQLQFARRATQDAVVTLREADASDPRVAELLALNGYTFMAFAENFCSGVPFSTAPAVGDLEFGSPQTSQQIFEIAAERFDEAIGEAGASAEVADLARVGKARALLGLGRFEEAAQAVSGVPTSFLYTISNSTTSGRQENGFFAANTSTLRLSIANDEGGPDFPFLDASTAGSGLEFLAEMDPRIPYSFVPNAFDRNFLTLSPAAGTYILQAYGGFGIPLSRSAPMPLATGIEARLIEAEAALRGGDSGGALTILNDLRANSGLELDPLPNPGSPQGMVDLLFKERAFWLYATGHRLGDLRRLIRFYDRTEDQVFPSGAYFKGGTYGDDVNLPIPFDEQNNPNFDQCLDRNA
jgi:hypothetical protein